ncbi:Signal recognition particle 19 kDa protein [Giardia muris]|uniref:Signal recognition particle 19 kDa protein n=1 Tax=Giardia muris TaxID=5742 RepID=A0A4Z1SS57_GIAMU|nr:Signal recognition particle 19 kDa protein [Giardia muris]|eukprot:TNJ26488.1 Signal recognition particle 19 kDa protein [Giardia muris]
MASVIYPRYLDSTARIRMGRRVGIEDGVPRPSVAEIVAAIKELYPEDGVEQDEGRYPRGAVEEFELGRIKVSKELIKRMGGKVPFLRSLRVSILDAREKLISLASEAQEKASSAVEGQSEASSGAQGRAQQPQRPKTRGDVKSHRHRHRH